MKCLACNTKVELPERFTGKYDQVVEWKGKDKAQFEIEPFECPGCGEEIDNLIINNDTFLEAIEDAGLPGVPESAEFVVVDDGTKLNIILAGKEYPVKKDAPTDRD